LRSKPVLTAVGPVEVSRPYYNRRGGPGKAAVPDARPGRGQR
jgi:hypothetical protein